MNNNNNGGGALEHLNMRQSLWDMLPYMRELRELNDKAISTAYNTSYFFVFMPILGAAFILGGLWWWWRISYYETPQKQKSI
jgi:hypothetical protein